LNRNKGIHRHSLSSIPHPTEEKSNFRDVRMSGDLNNNEMERFNGEVRDREKIVRGVKKTDSPLLTGYQIYHNYMRPHMALKDKTPAEVAGIKVEGQDKWLTIIQNARKSVSLR
jgi:hypothetical protein